MGETQFELCGRCGAALVVKPVPGATRFPQRLEGPEHG
jgi:hypothetical protein